MADNMADNMSSGYSPGYDFSEDSELLENSIDKDDGFNFDDFVNDPSAGGDFDETSPSGGSPDSFSDSSSKRAKSISSTKTSFPGDQMNADGLGFKSEWPEDTMLSQDPPNPTFNGATVSLAAMERTNITNPMLLDTSPLLNSNTMFNAGVQAPKRTVAQNDHLNMNPDFIFGRGDNAYFSPQHLGMGMNDRSREVSPTSGNMSNACSPHPAHSMGYGFSGLPNLTPNMGPNWVTQHPMSVMPLGSPYRGLTPHIRFAIVPPLGTLPPKSRVETQIQIRMMICPLPPNIKSLHLPTYSIAKPKLLAKPSPPEPRADMYELQTVLVCSSAMGKPEAKDAALARARKAAQLAQFRRLGREVTEQPDEEPEAQDGGSVVICSNCISREKKRSQRKKNKKAEEEEIWVKNEDRRVVVFNTHEVREWTVPQPVPQSPTDYGLHAVDVPMRIACYCRHHQEKVGFQVIFTLMDYNGNVVAQALSPSIMITDDHKTPGTNAAADSQTMAPLSPTEAFRGPVNDRQSQRRSTSVGAVPPVTPISQMQERLPTPLTRPPSPTGVPHPKKRKSSNTPKMHNALSMTPLEPGVTPGMQFHSLQLTQPSATSPLASTSQSFGALGFSEGMGGARSMAHTFTSSPSPAGDEEQILSNVSVTPFMENMHAPPAVSAPPSGPVSRAPSPGLARRQMEEQIMGTFNQLYAPARPPESPFIHNIIPPEGPKGGGIEVSIFGNNISRDVTVMFGEAEAIAVTHWGPKAITCVLPPANGAFTVPVSLKQGGQRHFQREAKFFKYIDNDEDRILRQFVAVLAGQFTGQSSDAVELAKSFIQSMRSGQGGAGFPLWGTGDGGAEGSGAGSSRSQSSRATLEPQLLKLLELIDMFKDPTDQTGQTMMHLACSLGFSRLVAGLIARGASPDMRDRGGYTPLHFAALNGHVEIIPRLISSGADPAMRSLNGLTAADMASSDEIIKYLRHVGGHRRTRSRVSLPSSGSSVASLNLLGELSSRLERAAGVDPLPDEESPEYSSSEDADTASNSEELWLKPNSRIARDFHAQDVQDTPQEPDIPKAASSPTLKDQFAAQWQQFHQSMVQNLPQFRQLPQLPQLPYMPQFPNMPQLSQLPYLPQFPNVHLLAEYQAAIQRIAAIMPARGYRSGSTGSQTSGKEVDTSPPPAYEEIFPPKQSSVADIKQESAARATLEAEADAKCAVLFETQADETESSQSVETTDDVEEDSQTLPVLLQIGRKNAITKQQQEDLRRAHAARVKDLSGDMKLFFIWIPLLLLVSAAMFYGTMRGMFSALMVHFAAMLDYAYDEMRQVFRAG